MGLLRTIERRLTELLEGGFARTFRGALPRSALLRAVADGVQPSRRSDGLMVATNRVAARLNPEDLALLATREAPLRHEAATAIREAARRQGLELVGRPHLLLSGDVAVRRGMVEIDAAVVEGPGPAELVDGAGRAVLRLDSATASIGREASCELVLEAPGVSRLHARLEPAVTGWALADTGSTNGTLVNGRPTGRQHLADGDVVQFGEVRLRFRER